MEEVIEKSEEFEEEIEEKIEECKDGGDCSIKFDPRELFGSGALPLVSTVGLALFTSLILMLF